MEIRDVEGTKYESDEFEGFEPKVAFLVDRMGVLERVSSRWAISSCMETGAWIGDNGCHCNMG